jgi:chromosome segregation ATPase
VIVILCSGAWPSLARAELSASEQQELAGLGERVESVVRQRAALQGQKAALEAEQDRAPHRQKQLTDEIQRHEEMLRQHNASLSENQDAIRRHNAGCIADPENAAAIQVCNQHGDALNRRKQQLSEDARRLDENSLRLNQRTADLRAGDAELAAAKKKNQAELDQLDWTESNLISQVYRFTSPIAKRERVRCESLNSLEAAKQCLQLLQRR